MTKKKVNKGPQPQQGASVTGVTQQLQQIHVSQAPPSQITTSTAPTQQKVAQSHSAAAVPQAQATAPTAAAQPGKAKGKKGAGPTTAPATATATSGLAASTPITSGSPKSGAAAPPPPQATTALSPGGAKKAKGKARGPTTTTSTCTLAHASDTTSTTAVALPSQGGGDLTQRRRRPRPQDDYYLTGLPPPPAQTRKEGLPIEVITNHFAYQARSTEFYQYQLNFQPIIPSRSMRIAVVHDQLWSKLGPFIFDGTLFFSTRRVPEGDHKIATKNQSIHIASLVFTTIVRPGTPQVFQLFNIHLRKLLVNVLHLKAIGRNWYDDVHPRHVAGINNIELWNGVIATLFPAAGAPFFTLNVDLSHKVIRTDTVAQELMQIFTQVRGDVEQYKIRANEELPGQTVLTRYTKMNSRPYQISHLDWEKSPTTCFENDQGQQMSFAEYYKQHYSIALRATTPPLVAVKQGDKFIFLMPELCFMTGLSEGMRKNFTVMKTLADYTRLNASISVTILLTFNLELGTRAQEIIQIVDGQLNSPTGKAKMAEFSATLNPEFMRINARRINPENIIFGRGISAGRENANWSNELSRFPPLSVVAPGTIAVIFPERLQNETVTLVNALSQIGAPMGFQFRAASISLQYDRRDDYIHAVQQAASVPDVKFILCVMFSEAKDKYDAIKQHLTSEATGRPSQVVLAKSLDPHKLNTVCQRILLQINCKLGGELWTVDIPLKDTMICGIDVCHARGRSVLGFVGTTNATFSKYHANVTFHERGQEVSSALKPLMMETLKAYFAINKALPKRLFVYRDGVGDGMLKEVLEKEVGEFETAFQSFPGYKPKLSVIVVKKRIHTRLFLTNMGNPGPGTIVDNGCTHKGWYDFYVVSNAVTQGTVTPTHYHVIRDDNLLSESQMHSLSFKLTHMYYNWPGTIRVPAPCQYAHKLAFLVGQSTQRAPVQHLCDKLFFL
ncbi:piwi A [Pelomyxa schiedti]|nr:piwi A [Pelomyxa schiedti]